MFSYVTRYLSGMKYISVSQDGLLLQVSAMSEKLVVEFADGVTQTVPASYIEFVERLILPQFKDVQREEVISSSHSGSTQVGWAEVHLFV